MLLKIDIVVILRLKDRLHVDQVEAEVPRHVHVEHHAIAEVLEALITHRFVLHSRVVHGLYLLDRRRFAVRLGIAGAIKR